MNCFTKNYKGGWEPESRIAKVRIFAVALRGRGYPFNLWRVGSVMEESR